MGHDVTVYHPGVDQEALHEELKIGDYDRKEWVDDYEEYCDRTQLAYIRRAAGNPLNQVIYLALGVMDEAYAGCSGNGAELDFTRDQLESAKQILEVKNFGEMTRERNLVDAIVETLAGAGASLVGSNIDPTDISQEKKFIQQCLDYLDVYGDETISISFS